MIEQREGRVMGRLRREKEEECEKGGREGDTAILKRGGKRYGKKLRNGEGRYEGRLRREEGIGRERLRREEGER